MSVVVSVFLFRFYTIWLCSGNSFRQTDKIDVSR